MTEIHPGQRVAIVADAQNLYHTAQSLYSRNIDYSSLLKKGTAGRDLTRAIAYVIRADSPDEDRFFDALV
ncbi:NYN domain-containing protein, partial [Halorubrum sp. Atlit-28R]|uniref:NYN domain-containing protein n=1 Tax=Halorubrum sp. Atlit-28R TaxID=2282129 RepID=UPI000EF1A6CE